MTIPYRLDPAPFSDDSDHTPEKAKFYAAQYWAKDPFYSPDSVVLGLDIGIEGIGICIRKGKEILFCKSLLVDLPEAKALATRRAFRAARHARKNRRTRMRRLKDLFSRHGLPWLDETVMKKTDPFLLRHRAVTKKLASKEALSVCIRSLVLRRGYDYDVLKDQNSYPWGDTTTLSAVKSWLATAYINQKTADLIYSLEEEITDGKGQPLKDDFRDELHALVRARQESSAKEDINAMTAAYAASKSNHRRARGKNYPRAMVQANLMEILDRHRELIDDYDNFIAALFRPCKTREDREHAIFHYNRKTADESRAHFEKKVKDCPYADWLQIPEAERKCALNGDEWVRRWKLIEFLSVRRFYLKKKEKTANAERRTLPAAVVEHIMQIAVPDGGAPPKWADAKKTITAALEKEGYVSFEKSATGKEQKDCNKEQKNWNKEQQNALKDLVSPLSGSLKGRASICSASAKKLYLIATQNGTEFEPELIEQEKKACGLYERKQEISIYGAIYPQVSTLLGVLGKNKKTSEIEQKNQGVLHRIFKDLKDKLGGKDKPDYVVVECIRSAAKNKNQAKEITEKIKDNRTAKEKLARLYGLETTKLSRSERFRLALWKQQGGTKEKPAICPFTGKALPVESPFSPELELAHIFPDSKGGLYVLDNLVLTTGKTNAAMGNRTPIEAADAGIFGISRDEMLANTKRFLWNEDKRRFFAHGADGSQEFPDFNNLTRVSQLASQLRKQIAFWLGILNDYEAQRLRLGSPNGEYTTAMRRSLLSELPGKDRGSHTHHREDAALLSCIPPTGMNSVLYKGIFYTAPLPYQDKQGKLKYHRAQYSLSVEHGLPLPDLETILADETECPVMKKRSTSKYKPLGDSTFWRVDKEGHTWQRTPLTPNTKDVSKDTLPGILRAMGIKDELIPSPKEIEKWIQRNTLATKDEQCPDAPLLLTNGVPVKSIWKKDGKGSLTNSPMGWSSLIDSGGTFCEARSLDSSNDRLELWIGWNAKKNRWEYQTRVIPTQEAMRGIKRMGLSWKSKKNLPPFLKELLERKKASSLKELICGKLLPHSVHVMDIRKGMVVRTFFSYHPKKAEPEKHGLSEIMWGELAAILTSGQLKFNSLTRKDVSPVCPASASKIAELLGLPSPEEYAQQHHLKP